MEKEAFIGCTLKTFNLPKGLTEIPARAFYGCKCDVKSITIPDNITKIGESAFEQSSNANNSFYYLESITIPESVTSIGEKAFYDLSNLKTITIPKTVTNIGKHAFDKTAWLREKQEENPLVIVNGILIDGKTASGDVVIPETFNGEKVTKIIADAFILNKNITGVTIPNSVTSIGDRAFYKCESLESVVIPDSITSIGNWTFTNCKSLENVTLPNTITSIGDYAFKDCDSLKNITIPESVTSIGGYAFASCDYLSSFVIPEGVTLIERNVLQDCQRLLEVTIPKSVNVIDYMAFYGCYSLVDLYYTGSNQDWNMIEIDSENDNLANADMHFDQIIHIHSYTETITKEPTCTEAGEKTKTCSECGDTYTETIPATGHTEVIDKVVPATCTTNGKSEGSHCSVCGEVIKAQKVIKATGHKFGSWSTTKSATCTENGTQTRKCTTCGKTETKTIPATGHKSSNWIVDKPAAIGVKGSKHKECTVCGKVLETAEIPALSKQNISRATVTLSKSTYVYDGKAKKPSVTVKLGGKTLKNGTDYTVSYSNNVKAGTATVKITGKGDYTGSVTKNFNIKNDFKQVTITGISNKTYNGKSQTQKITVKFGGKTLKNGTDYTVSYSNNKKIGTASMKIVGKGDYAGTIERSFKINPVKLSISKLSAKSKAFKASWAKNDQATGYEIQYSTNSKFKSAKKVAITKKDHDC